MAHVMYSIEEARRIFADHGYVSRRSVMGAGLVVYDGDEDRPDTWMEVGRVSIVDDEISSGAVKAIVGED